MTTFRRFLLTGLLTFLLVFGSSQTVISQTPESAKKFLALKRKSPQSASVSVYALVGQYFIESLTGWSSPYSEVSLTTQSLIYKTTARADGAFGFYFIPLPGPVNELCLVAQDVNQLPSYPLCLAPPQQNRSLQIRDVLLSPTLSVEGNQIPTGKTTKASGMTFPDAKVDVYLFTDPSFSFWFKIKQIFPTVLAAGLPRYQVKANPQGYFEFSLPASAPSFNRLFVTAQLPKIIGSGSPKSNTLAFTALGLWGLLKLFFLLLYRNLLSLLASLKGNLLKVVLLELVLFITFIVLLLIVRPRSKK